MTDSTFETKRMKVYLQKKMTTCMTTCLNMVFDDAAGTNDGPDSDCENGEERSRRALSRLAKEKGVRHNLDAKLIWRLEKDVRKLKPGSLILWDYDDHHGHCVVFDGFDGDGVLIRDPLFGAKRISLTEFDEFRIPSHGILTVRKLK